MLGPGALTLLMADGRAEAAADSPDALLAFDYVRQEDHG
jgi:hypothetical protein